MEIDCRLQAYIILYQLQNYLNGIEWYPCISNLAQKTEVGMLPEISVASFQGTCITKNW